MPEAVGIEVQMSGSAVSPQGWRYTHGTCSVEVVAESISNLAYSAIRGSICVVKMGFPGYSLGEFEPIYCGVVNNITGSAPSWNITLFDATYLLTSRLSFGAADRSNQNNLFYNVGGGTSYATTVTGSTEFTANSSTELDLTDASVLEKLSGSGTIGALVADDGTNDPFVLLYDTIAGNQVQGIETSNKFGTTQRDLSAGMAVYNAAYLEGDPRVILLRLLISASNSSTLYDKYPDSWGYGLPIDLIDVDEVINVQTVLSNALSSGSYVLQYVQSEQVTNSWLWLSSWFKSLGIIPVQRQGLISMRAIQDPSKRLFWSGYHISDDDIESVSNWSAYHPEMVAEYQQTEVFTGQHNPASSAVSSKTSYSVPATLPVADTVSYLAADKIYQNQTAIANEIKSRVGLWGPNIAEVVTLQCAGLRLAGLAPADMVYLSTEALKGGRIDATRSGYSNQPCMVLKVATDFVGGRVTLELAAIDPL
ncbi:MAG: hypothetical protein Tp1111DCM511881_43 [Prokaryotic dsDNA virus sp.]|nr:MAG: hypothetical protein Tp1111DCM511881_43 [Prokaryotic dsDNA virus sp.]